MNLEKIFITNETNQGKANTNHPYYIVIHDTGNTDPTAGAYNHYLYIQNHDNTNRSAHIYVDSQRAIQTMPFSTPAWHTGKWYVDQPEVAACTNYNSVAIEFCVNQDGNLEQTIVNTIYITQQVMKQLNIPFARIITHQQSSGKDCPMTFIKSPKLKELFFSSLYKQTLVNDLVLQKALEQLEAHKVINSKDYWYAKAQDVKYLRGLIVNMATALKGAKK